MDPEIFSLIFAGVVLSFLIVAFLLVFTYLQQRRSQDSFPDVELIGTNNVPCVKVGAQTYLPFTIKCSGEVF